MSNKGLSDVFSGDWRDYVKVNGFTEKDSQLIEGTLDRMTAQIPEFCDLLRASQAVYLTHYDDGTEKELDKIVICQSNGYRRDDLPGIMQRTASAGRSHPADRLIQLDPQMLNNVSYYDKSGKEYLFSLQNVIFHEFIHMTDPMVTVKAQKVYEESVLIQQDVDSKYQLIDKLTAKLPSFLNKLKERWSDYKTTLIDEKIEKFSKIKTDEIEQYTVERTSAVMHRHFGEAPIDGYTNTKVNYLNLYLTKGSDPLVHTSTEQDKSFIPLTIVDIVDPERMKLATELARTIQAKIDEDSAVSEITPPDKSLNTQAPDTNSSPLRR